MKLTYRGHSYDYNPPVIDDQPTDLMGKYRGVDVQFKSAENLPPAHAFKADRVYRGVAYTVGESPAKATTAGEVPTIPISINERMRALIIKHLRNVRRREQSMLARVGQEVGLSVKSAANYESSIQGKVPHNFIGYDRSGAAMS